MLKQLGNAKEERSSLLRRECLASIEQVDNPCQESSTFPRRNGRLVEDPSLLNDGRLVIVERCNVSFMALLELDADLHIPPDSSSFLNDMVVD